MEHGSEIDAGGALAEHVVGVGGRLALQHGQQNLLLRPHGVLRQNVSECGQRTTAQGLTGFFALALLSLSLHSSALRGAARVRWRMEGTHAAAQPEPVAIVGDVV